MNWLIGILVVGWLLLFVPMAILPFFSTDDVELAAPVTKSDAAPPTQLRHAPAPVPVPHPSSASEPAPVSGRRAA